MCIMFVCYLLKINYICIFLYIEQNVLSINFTLPLAKDNSFKISLNLS